MSALTLALLITFGVAAVIVGVGLACEALGVSPHYVMVVALALTLVVSGTIDIVRAIRREP